MPFAFLAFMALATAAPRFEVPIADPSILALVRLDGRVYCTAFVVEKGLALTAAHCVEGEKVLLARSSSGAVHEFKVAAKGTVDSHDFAVLTLDTGAAPGFKLSEKAPLPQTRCGVIGHGGGSKVANGTPCEVVGTEDGYLKLAATVIPGDSGAPVFDADTAEVIGIAVRTSFPTPVGLATQIEQVRAALKAARKH